MSDKSQMTSSDPAGFCGGSARWAAFLLSLASLVLTWAPAPAAEVDDAPAVYMHADKSGAAGNTVPAAGNAPAGNAAAGNATADNTAAAANDEPADAPEDPFADPFSDSPFMDDPFGIETTDWDSVFAAVDDEFEKAQGNQLIPLFGIGYGKKTGFHFNGGVGIGPAWKQRIHLGARMGYDVAREKPTGRGFLRVGDLARETYWAEFRMHSGVRAFGSHQPYGNTLFAFVGGYDGQSYLLQRAGALTLHWQPDKTWTARVRAERREEQSAPLKEDYHWFGSDRWMDLDTAVDDWIGNGIGVSLSHRPRYSEDVVLPGAYFSASVESWGGALGGSSEHSLWSFQWKQIWKPFELRDEFYLLLDYGATGGQAPTQALQDIGSEGGLRGFVPRSYVGTQRWLLRAQYMWRENWMKRTRIPLIKEARLRLVPFAEAGSVWGGRPLENPEELQLPLRSEVHWDLGFGLRRIVDSSGLLSYLQVDFAWPMGADSGPARITLSLSGQGFD